MSAAAESRPGEAGYAFSGSPAKHLLTHAFDGKTYAIRLIRSGRGGSGPLVVDSGLLGGFELAEAVMQHPRAPGSTRARVEFHGGMNTWQFVIEQQLLTTLPHQARGVGMLSECMKRFETETGLRIPPVTWAQVGIGVSIVTSDGTDFDAKNPFRLAEGVVYQIPFSKDVSQFTGVRDKFGNLRLQRLTPEGNPIDGEGPIDQTLVFTDRALLKMRCLDASRLDALPLDASALTEAHARSSYRPVRP